MLARASRLYKMASISRSRKNDYPYLNNENDPFSGEACIDSTKTVNKLPAVSVWLIIFVFNACVVLYADLVNRPFFSPSPKTKATASTADFVEERVRETLLILTGYGQRTVGSYENEVLAKDFFVRQIQDIRKEANRVHQMEVEVQNVSGQFQLGFLGGLNHVYRNIKNVVVKFAPIGGAGDSLLVNCHYDTFINTPGASDDAASCCVMLETLRAFSQTSTPFKHNIIFLFNGAEENLLQGSHGFITQHRWASEVRAFVNLEAAGAGGREMVFQTGPENPWIIKAYSEAAPYPFGTTLGQDVFQTGLVPGDTDFRIFRDFGGVPGLDLAYISNGFVYHTKFDTVQMIPEGSLQRTGDNLISLLKKLSNSETLRDPGSERHGAMVYFDIGSQFIVTYPQRLGTLINSLTVFLVFYGLFSRIMGNNKTSVNGVDYLRLIGSAVAAIFATWLLLLVVVVTMAAFITLVGRSMSWYTHSVNLAVLFVLPSVLVFLAFHSYLQKTVFKAHNPWLVESTFFEANLCIWAFITLIVTKAGLCSAYLPMLWVLGPLAIREKLMQILNIKPKENPYTFVSLHISGLLIPTLCYLYPLFNALELFMPIMGRIGQTVPPDITVSILVLLGVIPCVSFQIGFVYITDCMKTVYKGLGGIIAVGLVLIILTPLGFPYRYSPKSPTCQRHSFIHIERNFHGLSGEITHTDSGVWNLPLDYFGDTFISKYVPEVKSGKPISCREPYCGVPMYFPVIEILDPRTTEIIPGSRLNVKPRLKAVLTSRETINKLQRLTFTVTGPDHITVYISPWSDVTLTAWSIGDERPIETIMPSYANRTNYFVYYSYAELPTTPWQFHLDLQVSPNHEKNLPIIDIAFSGHYIHGKYNSTTDLDSILNRLPPWSCIMSFVSSFDSYQF